MSDVKADKVREVVPDIQLSISKAHDKVYEIEKQVSRVNYALHGPQATSPDCEEKGDREKGSIECLEDSAKYLFGYLVKVEKELRNHLDLLLGIE